MPTPVSRTRIRTWFVATSILARRFGDEPDVPAGGRELHRIVQEVDEDLRQTDRIAINRDGLVRQGDRQRVTRRSDPWTRELHRRVDEGCQVQPLLAKLDLPLRDPRHVEQIVDDPDQVGDLPIEHLPRPRAFSRLAVGALQQLEREAHRRQRISQFMRQDAEEFVLSLVDQAQGFRIDAQRLGLPRVGDVVHCQEDECRPLLAFDGPGIQDERTCAALERQLHLEVYQRLFAAACVLQAVDGALDAFQMPCPISQMCLPSICSAVSPMRA